MLLFFKNLLFVLIVPGTVAVWAPLWIERATPLASNIAVAAASVLVLAGAAGLGWCVWGFAAFGRATPLPLDAPHRLVVRGLYRYTRNPMYVSVLTIILGWALMFASWRLVGYALVVAVGFHLFVLLYEEPRLQREFGKEYDEYRARVGRWGVRLRN